ncbi:MAG: trypsin-like peptidase domain-containing protein [Acidimicrobiales bacterium]
MRPPGRRRVRWLQSVVAMALVASVSACGSDDPVATPAASATTPDVGPVPDDHGLSEQQLAAVLPSTVSIQGVACGRVASGSGFALTDTLVVTNAHVILGIDEITVHTFDGDEFIGTPVAFDADADLAILDVPDADFVPLPLTERAANGSTGVLVGWERGGFADPTPYRVERRVTVRIESVGSTTRVERPAWLIAAEVQVGDSGAALVDRTGEVIGVAFATSTAGEGVGYAVRSTAIEELMARGLDPNQTVPDC